ncbi:SEC-C metal-binding domain-containing protein [Rhizobium sp. BE258]|uniref:SEC-C metal-binding domain-containing protein n=1 Tax=Rhizobium sp. BE258 TaxID=2817722 RepID=UPI003864313B
MAKKVTKRELRANTLCPCGSGETYKNCHKKTKKKYFENEHGEISFEVPLTPNFSEQLENSRKEFKRIFGRSPYKSDPLIWNRSEVKPSTLLKHTKKAMRKSNMECPPFRRTAQLLRQCFDELPWGGHFQR